MRVDGMARKHYFNAWEGAVNALVEANESGDFAVKQVEVITTEDGLDDDHLERHINSVGWTSTENPVPHEYIREWDDPDLYWELVHRIDTEGVERRWQTQVRNYYDFGDYRYWHMGGDPFIVLNRERIEQSTATVTKGEQQRLGDEYS